MTLPDWLDRAVLGNQLRDWAAALGVALSAWVVVTALRGVVLRRLEKIAASTTTIADDVLVELIRSISKTYVALAALCFGMMSLHVSPLAGSALRWLAAIVLVAQGVRSANRVISFWLEHYASTRGGFDRTTLSALNYALRGLTFAIVAVVALHNLGVQVTALITGLGVGGIAIALALQNILGDLFGALSIVLDKPFVVGDTIAVDQLEGTVEHIGLKTTRVRSINGEQLVFSNADLLRSRLRNFSRRQGRRLVFTISVEPGTAAARLARVPAIVAEAVAAEPRASLQRTHIVGFGPLGFDVETSILVPHPEYDQALDARQAILLAVYARMQREGIALARPANAAVQPVPPVA
jgi:small-conductance mechanosensitive channel